MFNKMTPISYKSTYNKVLDNKDTFQIMTNIMCINNFKLFFIRYLVFLKKRGSKNRYLDKFFLSKVSSVVLPLLERNDAILRKQWVNSLSLNLAELYSNKQTFIDIKLFVSNYNYNIYNYNYNKDIFFLNKKIYFFNVNKLLFILSQFSFFFEKLLHLRCNLLFCSFNFEDYSYFSSSIRL